MKLCISLVLLFIFTKGNGQQSNNIAIGKIEKIYSKELKEEKKIWIYNPGDDQKGSARKEHYPV